MPNGSWREFDLPPKSKSLQTQQVKEKHFRQVRVEIIRVGKRGKTITSIKGLGLGEKDSRILLKRLKTQCGTGGTLKGDEIELQGDKVEVVLSLLEKEGFSSKKKLD
mgnify:CR=1 FL=1|tara:strand:- start:182 stop:502 length:321 start_codon:yes stop_codon:yes gene_type:complete